MRSYIKVYVTTIGNGEIFPAKFADEIGLAGFTKRLQFPEQLAATVGYNLLIQADWWLGFSGTFPQNLSWGSATMPGAVGDGSGSQLVAGNTGQQLANSCFQLLDYATHPLN